MPKFLPVKGVRQSESMCGPTCLKMVFQYYGTHTTEAAIAKAGNATVSLGTSKAGMEKAAAHFGFTLKTKDRASFGDIKKLLEKGIPPIVDWWSETDGHYSVVVGLDEKNIYLRDPEWSKIHPIDRTTFYRNWFDFRGNFIRDPKELFVRRLMIVEPKKKRPAD